MSFRYVYLIFKPIARHFVPNLSVGPVVAAALRKHCPYAHIDCHLMVTDPINYIEPLANAGVSSITFHYETILSKGSLYLLVNFFKIIILIEYQAVNNSTI